MHSKCIKWHTDSCVLLNFNYLEVHIAEDLTDTRMITIHRLKMSEMLNTALQNGSSV